MVKFSLVVNWHFSVAKYFPRKKAQCKSAVGVAIPSLVFILLLRWNLPSTVPGIFVSESTISVNDIYSVQHAGMTFSSVPEFERPNCVLMYERSFTGDRTFYVHPLFLMFSP